MRLKNKNKQVAEKIIEILRNGLTINADTLHYIDSTFSNPSIDELAELLQDESSCETDSMLELLFFPDESVQLQLEDMLENIQFQEQDEHAIQQLVCSESFQTPVRLPDNRGTLGMEVTALNVMQFIAHLHLLRHINPKLTEAINEHVSPAFQTQCKVKLRNTRPIASQNKLIFLQAFFEKLPGDSDEILHLLDFMLSFLDECKDEADVFQSLMARKKFYFQSLQKAKNLDIQLAKQNVETLLLRGKRVAYIDKADARQKIQMIDRISLAIFGKTEFFDLLPAGEQSIDLEGKEDIDKLIRKFS
jgi:hypothetical protein